MGLPEKYNKIIKRHLNMNGAWIPVTDDFQPGDFGDLHYGVFKKEGNIKDFGVMFDIKESPHSSTLNFTSANTVITRFDGGAQVEVIPATSVNARINIAFQDAESFIIKFPKLTVTEIENVYGTAQQLKEVAEWKKKWKVISKIYKTENAVIIANNASGTELNVTGELKALEALKLADVSLQVATTKELGLEIRGLAGPVGLGLFKIKLLGGLEVLNEEEDSDDALVETFILVPEVKV